MKKFCSENIGIGLLLITVDNKAVLCRIAGRYIVHDALTSPSAMVYGCPEPPADPYT